MTEKSHIKVDIKAFPPVCFIDPEKPPMEAVN